MSVSLSGSFYANMIHLKMKYLFQKLDQKLFLIFKICQKNFFEVLCWIPFRANNWDVLLLLCIFQSLFMDNVSTLSGVPKQSISI